ncbi:MAG: HAMP domain-containing protein [Myxococcales bacterium]|nr:HAMP domain-containing protein [Myxococcales bacterium]
MTTSTAAPPAPAQQGGRHQRSIKNYLLDARFQLKYSGFLVGVALVVSALLGAFLYSTSREVVAQSQKVVDESRKVSEIVRMNIKDDPMYKDNPELAKSFNDESGASEMKIVQQQQSLISKQRTMLQSLVGGLLLMCFIIGIMGIYITHKIAGPIYKMKMLLRQVGDGKLNFRAGRLRKGDELQEFFETFEQMVEKLKARQAKEVATLEAALEEARRAGVGDTSLSKIASVRDEMKAALDV